MKQQIAKALIGLALVLALLGGVALNGGAAVAHTAPAHHLLACGVPTLPPCS